MGFVSLLRTAAFRQPVSRVGARLLTVRYQSTIYQDLKNQLKTDLKQAMIAKDSVKKDTVRSLMSAIKNKEIDLKEGTPTDEFLMYEILYDMANQRLESIEMYAGRQDLIDKENNELNIIHEYIKKLPVASLEEIDEKLQKIIDAKREELGDKLEPKHLFKTINFRNAVQEFNTSPGVLKDRVLKLLKKK